MVTTESQDPKKIAKDFVKSEFQIDCLDAIRDRYKPIKTIAAGGFGNVYLAKQVSTGQSVAIKTFNTLTGEDKEKTDIKIERFKREITLCAALQHPNIVRILDSSDGEKDEKFIVFEYIEGPTLSDLIKKEGALSIERTGKIMLQILDGINAAHEKGIVHRDLKPENIMVIQTSALEQAKILDFGIGTFIPGKYKSLNRLTGSRDFLGTPMYAAPEQLRGEPVTPKCDLYSWGLLLLECLTGKPPFEGNSVAEVVRNQLSSQAVILPLALQEHKIGTFLGWILNKDVSRRAGDASLVFSRFDRIPLNTIQNKAGFLAEPDDTSETELFWKHKPAENGREWGERRQITALCISMGLEYNDGTIDPVVIEEIFDNITDICISMIEQAGGYVEGQVGENIMAVFGYPDINETDARRAIGTAFRILTSMMQRGLLFKSQYDIDLLVSMGIHTGIVTIRKKNKRDRIVGMTQHTAGKLSHVAPHGNIYISSNSFDLMKNYLKCEPINQLNLSLPGKIKVYKVIEEELSEGMTGNINKMTRFTLVGRANELYTLKKNFENSGLPILVQGEAGIGKSHLVAEIVKHIQEIGNSLVEFKCVPEGRKSALFPVFEIIRKHFGITSEKSADDTVNALNTRFSELQIDNPIVAPMLCQWLGIKLTRPLEVKLSPPKQKELLLDYLIEIFEKMAKFHLCAFAIEDLHWADSTTLEFISLFLKRSPGAFFLVMTSRLEFKHHWTWKQVEVIRLDRLMDADIENIISDVSESVCLPKEIITKMVNRSDGVPLFAKELTRMLADSERKARLETNFETQFEIPNTLRDLLASRLDKLGAAKESSQLASAIGRRFDYNLLAKLSLRDESVLLADLDQLISTGLIQMQHRAGDTPIYFFQHSLIRDSAYDSLTPQQKLKIHERIASILEIDFNELVSNQPEMVALHWANAGQFEKATDYGLLAANTSISKSFFQEAQAIAIESLAWVQQETESESSLNKALNLLLVNKTAFMATKGYASDELQQTLLEIEKICHKLPASSANLFYQLFDMIVYYVHLPNYQKVDQLLNQIIRPIEENPNTEQKSLFYSIKGYRTFLQGNLESARRNLNKSLEYHDEQKHKDQFIKYGHDSKIVALAVKGLLCTAMNLSEEAENAIDEGYRWAEALNNPQLKGFIIIHKLGVFHYRDQKSKLEKEMPYLIDFVKKYELMAWQVIANLYDAWCKSDLQTAKKNIQAWQQAGLNSVASYWQCLVAQIEFHNGLFDDAIKRLDDYIGYGEKSGELFYLPELYRLKGLSLKALQGDHNKTKACFEKSIELAEQTGAVFFKNRSIKEMQELF